MSQGSRDRGILLQYSTDCNQDVPGLAGPVDTAHPPPEEGRERLNHIQSEADRFAAGKRFLLHVPGRQP